MLSSQALIERCSTLYVAIGLLMSCAGFAFAQDRPQAAQMAINDIAKEMVECAAYFDIVSLALLNSKEADTAERFVRSRKLAEGRANSLRPGIVNAHYNAMIQDMTNMIVIANITKQIDKSLSNVLITDISVLRRKYGKLCKEVLSAPGARAKYWMKRRGGSHR